MNDRSVSSTVPGMDAVGAGRCATCKNELSAETATRFNGVCPWCLSAFLKPETEERSKVSDAPSPETLRRLVRLEPEARFRPVLEAAPGTPPELASIIEKCLAFKAEDRYATMGDMIRDLSNWQKGEPVKAHSQGVGYKASKFIGRHRWAVAALAALTLVGLAGSLIERGNASRRRHDAADVWFKLGEARLAMNDDAGAREAFTESINLFPRPIAYLARCFASWRLCDLNAALSDTDRAAELDPSNRAATRNRALIVAAAR